MYLNSNREMIREDNFILLDGLDLNEATKKDVLVGVFQHFLKPLIRNTNTNISDNHRNKYGKKIRFSALPVQTSKNIQTWYNHI